MPRGETCRHHTQWSVLDSGTIVKLVSRVVRRVIHLIPLPVEARPRPGQHEIGMQQQQQVETHSYYSARVRQLLQEAAGRGEAASQVELSTGNYTVPGETPTRTFSLLKAPTSTFTDAEEAFRHNKVDVKSGRLSSKFITHRRLQGSLKTSIRRCGGSVPAAGARWSSWTRGD